MRRHWSTYSIYGGYKRCNHYIMCRPKSIYIYYIYAPICFRCMRMGDRTLHVFSRPFGLLGKIAMIPPHMHAVYGDGMCDFNQIVFYNINEHSRISVFVIGNYTNETVVGSLRYDFIRNVVSLVNAWITHF